MSGSASAQAILVQPTTATLTPSAVGWGAGQGVQCADVTGDGVADCVCAAPATGAPPATQVGAVFVWNGGAGLTGQLAAHGVLRDPNGTTGDRLGE